MTLTPVFVTGANSFLGATLVRYLVEAGHVVRGLIRPSSNDILLHDLPLERVVGDLLEPESYRHALQGCQTMYHVAAAYTHDPQRLAEMEMVNGEGTRRVLTAAIEAGVPKLLHTSTIGTIGQPLDGSLATEQIPFNLTRTTAYVRSKLAGERIADTVAAEGAALVVVHPTAMLGAGDWRPTASGRLVLDFLRGIVPRYPAGGINWCPVDDIARGMMLAVERGLPGRHYILGHRQGNLDLPAFLTLLSSSTGLPQPRPPRPSFSAGLQARLRARLRSTLTPEPTETTGAGAAPERLTCNPARAISELDMPQSDLAEAIRREVGWYRQHGYV